MTTINSKTSSAVAPRVSGIIVTYKPEIAALDRLIEAVAPQLTNLIIVDNGSEDYLSNWLSNDHPQVVFIALGDNKGIAKAQNDGIAYAKELGSDYVLLLDQDSTPAPNMVQELVHATERKQALGIKVACAGPRYDDPRQKNPVPFIQVKNYRVKRQQCGDVCDIVDVDYLIASGCLIPIRVLDSVGLMQEELFIDYVDIEWGLRAQAQGFQSLGVCAAVMHHQLGDEPIYFRGRYIPVHSPLRHYYHFRNAIWLYKQPWLRFDWKVVDGVRLLRKYGFYTLITKPRFEHFRMMTLGMFHGLMNKLGRLDSK